jgi:DNA-binding transcriptional ArsR family regulator
VVWSPVLTYSVLELKNVTGFGYYQVLGLKAMLELRPIYGDYIPLRTIQDQVCFDIKPCRRRVAAGLRRLRRRGLLKAVGCGRGLWYAFTRRLLDVLRRGGRRVLRRKRRSTRPVDAPFGTMLRVLKMVLESRVGVYTREIEARLGISRVAVRYHVNRLKALGLIVEPVRGYVKPAPLDMARLEKALQAARDLRIVLEAVGLVYANGRVQPRLFTAKETALVMDSSLRKAQELLRRLRGDGVIIRVPGRRCRLGVYVINPVYPSRLPEHRHDRDTIHLYGGARRRRKLRTWGVWV